VWALKEYEMTHYSFTVEVSYADTHSQVFEDRLYEAGCDDALVAVVDGKLLLDFGRSALDFDKAVELARNDIERAGGHVISVEPIDEH
jgi:hypothetical protein